MNANLSFSRQARHRSPIGLTSLIDVVFILLLFFMLTSTFSPLSALDLTPASSGGAERIPDAEPLIIQVVDAAHWRIEAALYNYPNTTHSMLQQAIARQAPVLVRAESNASVQHLVSALDYLTQQGVTNLHLGESTVPDNAR